MFQKYIPTGCKTILTTLLFCAAANVSADPNNPNSHTNPNFNPCIYHPDLAGCGYRGPTQSAPPSPATAIAFDENTGIYGLGYHLGRKRLAKKFALESCREKSTADNACKIVDSHGEIAYNYIYTVVIGKEADGKFRLYYKTPGMFGLRKKTGKTKTPFSEDMMAKCNKEAVGCEVKVEAFPMELVDGYWREQLEGN